MVDRPLRATTRAIISGRSMYWARNKERMVCRVKKKVNKKEAPE
jgi:hypothetical protein